MAQDRISSTYIFRYTTWINNREQRQKYRVTTEQYDWFRKKKKKINLIPSLVKLSPLRIFPSFRARITKQHPSSRHPSRAIKGWNDRADNAKRLTSTFQKAIQSNPGNYRNPDLHVALPLPSPCQKSKQCPNYGDDIDGRKGLSRLRLTLVLQITGFRFGSLPAARRMTHNPPRNGGRVLLLVDRDAKANISYDSRTTCFAPGAREKEREEK